MHGAAPGMGVGHRQELFWSHRHRTRTRTRTAVGSEDPNRREAATPPTITWQAGEGWAAGSGHSQKMGVFRAHGVDTQACLCGQREGETCRVFPLTAVQRKRARGKGT